jgi:hypothetical protein
MQATACAVEPGGAVPSFDRLSAESRGSLDCDAVPFASFDSSCLFDCNMDSMPSMGSLSALPCMPMSFDAADADPASAQCTAQSDAAAAAIASDSVGVVNGLPPQPDSVWRDSCALATSPPALPPSHPPDDPPATVPVHPPPPVAAAPATPLAVAQPSPFLNHCQVRPPEYPPVPLQQVSVPSGPQIYERMWAIRKDIEQQARITADTKQLRGGSHAATKQLEMQLDLVLRDYSARLNHYLQAYSHAVMQQQQLLQERNGLIGTGPDGDMAFRSNAMEAKLLTLAQECLKTIDGVLEGYTRDSRQLLAKYKEQQKKKEKLPESAVDTLNKWLHEHFANPYPTKSEKVALVHATGLEMKQINQWFINARVRVWKPAVRLMMEDGADDTVAGS